LRQGARHVHHAVHDALDGGRNVESLGQTINLGVYGYYSPSQALASAAVDYAEPFAVYLPAGSAAPPS